VPVSPQCMGGSKHDPNWLPNCLMDSWSRSCIFTGCAKIKHLYCAPFARWSIKYLGETSKKYVFADCKVKKYEPNRCCCPV
jgi:hypothetical protein